MINENSINIPNLNGTELVEVVVESIIEPPVEESVEEPVEESVEEPVETSVEASVEPPIEPLVEPSVEVATDQDNIITPEIKKILINNNNNSELKVNNIIYGTIVSLLNNKIETVKEHNPKENKKSNKSLLMKANYLRKR
jgi:hypothetical protein